MSKDTKSICLVIRRDQYDRLREMDINVSGFIRDIIDDRMSDHTIVINVDPETRLLYDQIVSTTPKGDLDLEPYLRESLKQLLDTRIEAMNKLRESL